MVLKFLFRASFLSSLLLGQLIIVAQDASPVKPPVYPSAINNFIRIWEAYAPESNPNNLMSRPLSDVKQVTQYFDGLGRSLQSVSKQGSLVTDPSNPLSSAAAKDLIISKEYDNLGLVTRDYLPFASTQTPGGSQVTNNGLFKIDPFEQQKVFYENQLSGQGESYYYSKTDFEPSFANRPVKTFAPGNSWVHDGRNVESRIFFNTATDNVKVWNVNASGSIGVFATYSASSNPYQTGTLIKSIVQDETGNQIIEFKDNEGKVILKKIQHTAAADDGSGKDYTGWLCTYYIYDDHNLLRAVIQPNAVAAMASGNSWSLDATQLNELVFRYEYDERFRMIMKKVPGAAEVYMVYDKRDRLVMTQDGNLRTPGQVKWMYMQYDNELNRPVATGLISDGNSLSYHTSLANVSESYPNLGNYSPDELTRSFYDDYTWRGNYSNPLSSSRNTSYDSYFSTPSATYPYPQSFAQSAELKGMVTGSGTKILGTSTYLYTVNFYDERGRVIQVQTQNVTTGTDIVSSQYSWAGQPLMQILKHEKSGSPSQTTVLVTQTTYDHLGRMITTEKKMSNTLVNSNGMSAYKVIAQNEYDALGKLKKKNLGTKPNTTPQEPLAKLEYEYNIRGWLLSINKNYVSGTTNSNQYFGMELGYDKNGSIGSFAPQYGGNIAGTIWKSEGDKEKRKYDFSYDNVNRLTAAAFTQPSSSAVDFSVSNLQYDANGNIKRMTQKGLKIGGSSIIDDLTYEYKYGANSTYGYSNSNKLLTVTEDASIGSTNNKLGDFTDGNRSGDDYDYDENGNLKLDNNKSISGITYNHLNLPSSITVTGKGSIQYTYDAVRNKLKKVTTDNTTSGKTVTITTSYVSGFVYESKVTSPADANNPDYTDVLQFTGHEEGRIRYVTANQGDCPGSEHFAFDYFLKDHLGNVRTVLTDDVKLDCYPYVTFEDGTIPDNPDFYDRESIGVTTANGSKMQLLTKTAQSMGVSKLLKVMANDNLNVTVDYYIPTANVNNGSADGTNTILSFIENLLNGVTAPGPLKGNGTPIKNSLTSDGFFTGILQNSNSNSPTSYAKVFLNILFFDEQFNFVQQNSEVIPLTTMGSSITIARNAKEATKNGYVYIFVSNESNNLAYFDNFKISHDRGPILEETHYYPFGLTMEGISSKAAGGIINRKKYNGIEETKDLDLNQYDAFYRTLDPQIGRFWQIDPQADILENQSPYESMGNNPISNVDPLGDFKTWFGAALHAFFNGGDVRRNDMGEWYVRSLATSESKEGGPTFTVRFYYGKGRDKYSTAKENLLRDFAIMDDIRQNGENSMYQMYDSPQESADAAKSYFNLLIPNAYIKPITIASNINKVSTVVKNTFSLTKHGELTNGVYIVSKEAMKKHIFGGFQGKSVFYPTLNAEEAVLKAAQYADEAGLWVGNKAKVPVTNTNIGTLGNGQPTNVINVYRNSNGVIHGSPGNF